MKEICNENFKSVIFRIKIIYAMAKEVNSSEINIGKRI
jgi:hypothetical protein